MNKIVSIAILFLLTLTATAQNKKAKQLLDQVTAKIKSYDNITIDFKYTLNNLKENINKESKGNVIIQDNKYVLNFMENKVNELKQPFFAIDFNISTHFPGNLPSTYKEKYPLINRTARMKTMNYYNECITSFMKEASQQSWYKNTVFIFCSDHWMYPDFNNLKNDVEKNFRIALFIFDPQKNIQKIVNTPVSQLDILNTILHFGNYKKNFISYGEDLLEMPADSNRIVFAKANNILYQAFDSSYVLGFNVVQGKPEFCYNYIKDPERKDNLIDSTVNQNVERLVKKMKAFLHTGYIQYENKKVY